MKITITRALSELKTLKARYEKEVSDSKLIGVLHGYKLRAPYTSYTKESFASQASSMYQSIVDLEKRIIEIKTKIDISNFNTRIIIDGKEMSVLEAINLKSLIDLKKDRLITMKSQLRKARSSYDEAIEENNIKIEKQVQDQTSAGNKDPKIEEQVRSSIDNLYAVSLIDPVKLEESIITLEKEISNFENEVDFVLSESNSTTYIEVSD